MLLTNSAVVLSQTRHVRAFDRSYDCFDGFGLIRPRLFDGWLVAKIPITWHGISPSNRVGAFSSDRSYAKSCYRLAGRKQREQLEKHFAIGASEKCLTYNPHIARKGVPRIYEAARNRSLIYLVS
jgi:hypothetical protein